MDQNLEWVNKKKLEKTMKALEKNNIDSYLVNNKEELLEKINSIVKEGSVVSCGGSMTLFETGIIDLLRTKKYNFLDRYEENLTSEQIEEIYRKSFSADAYFTSTNAVTENGELYNVDGRGNRVAAMLYGPDKVIVVAGVNKIVKNIDEAIQRNKSICAPANTRRLGISNVPCYTTGECMDCSSKSRICCEYTVIKRQRIDNRMHVIFLNETLGY